MYSLLSYWKKLSKSPMNFIMSKWNLLLGWNNGIFYPTHVHMYKCMHTLMYALYHNQKFAMKIIALSFTKILEIDIHDSIAISYPYNYRFGWMWNWYPLLWWKCQLLQHWRELQLHLSQWIHWQWTNMFKWVLL